MAPLLKQTAYPRRCTTAWKVPLTPVKSSSCKATADSRTVTEYLHVVEMVHQPPEDQVTQAVDIRCVVVTSQMGCGLSTRGPCSKLVYVVARLSGSRTYEDIVERH